MYNIIIEMLLYSCSRCVFKSAAALTYAIVLEFSTRWLEHIIKKFSELF